MHCLDARAVINYLHGEAALGTFIDNHGNQPLFAPTVALDEAVVVAVRTWGPAGLEAAQGRFDWLGPMPLSVEGASEAARIDGELHDVGEPIGALEALIAGVVRDAGGTVVTRNSHFERVTGQPVHRYAG